MNDKVKAAVERLGNYRKNPPTGSDPVEVNHARAILADAYLAEHPDDDGEPVTAEWLESLGFHENPNHHGSYYWLPDECNGEGLELQPHRGCWSAYIGSNFSYWPADIHCRRQVRLLMESLAPQ